MDIMKQHVKTSAKKFKLERGRVYIMGNDAKLISRLGAFRWIVHHKALSSIL